MVRIDAVVAGAGIDWLNDGDTTDSSLADQDINFNGGAASPPSSTATDGPFAGSNDWLYINNFGLKQVGSRPNMGLASLEMATADLGRGDPGRGDPGRGDPGRGDPGRGDPGRGDPGRGDPGRGDPGRGDPGAPPGDLDFETANAIFNGPFSLTAQIVGKTIVLNWSAPHLMPDGFFVLNTTAYRVLGSTITPANWADRVLVGQALGTATTIVDPKPQNNRTYTYVVVSDLSNGATQTRSGISNPATITFR